MTAIRNQGVHRSADFPKSHQCVEVVTTTGLSGVQIYKFTPGYRFKLTKVSTFCRTKAGTVTATLKIGGRTAASLTFTADTENSITLSTTFANLIGSSTEAITIELTTDGSGALTNGKVVFQFRPWPLNGDIGTTS